MTDRKFTEQQLKVLAEKMNQDQAKTSPAEKRVKVNESFDSAVKKMGQTPPPKKESKQPFFGFGNAKYIIALYFVIIAFMTDRINN